MSETTPVVTIRPRPTSFHMKLHVDPADDNEDDIPLTAKSWRVQLLRLLQKAPQPVPVLCEEPRSFPHFENGSRISESSWTSDATHTTEITKSSGSGSLVSPTTTSKKGANEHYPTATVLVDDSSFKLVLATTTAKSKDVDDGDTLPIRAVQEGIEIWESRNSVNRKDEVEEKLPNCPSSPQENSNSKVPDNRKHQLQKDEETGSRNTLGFSIQGDSEYWEKFRYSKDYQSSLMIETICNEVFNLKPSPKYKSLMKLSETETASENIDKNKKEIPPSQLLKVVQSNDNDVERIKVGIVEETEMESGTKGARPSILTVKTSDERRGKEAHIKEKAENALSFQEDRRQQKDDIIQDNVDNNNVSGNGLKVGIPRQEHHKEMEIRNSIASSIFTTTSATTDGIAENDRRRRERMLLLEGFGQTFHGYLTKRETEKLLRNEGEYLIRQMWDEDGFILSFMFDRKIRNYRMLCEIGMCDVEGNSRDTIICDSPENNLSCTSYYLEDRRKCYQTVNELVREGLITLHLDENAGSYIDLLVELAQFQRNDNLLQTPPAVTPGSRKTSRSASFKMARLACSSSAFESGGTSSRSRGGSNGGDNSPSITNGRISMVNTPSFVSDIALLIHYFEEEIFDGLAKCHVCTNGIWGPSNKGLRCRDCNLAVHESCIDNVKSECKPDLTVLSPFSTDLTTLVKGSFWNNCSNRSYHPPYILETCINEVEARGLATEGIYRICGSVEEIDKLKNLFEKDKINTSLSENSSDIHSITSLIKLFFRQLPDPLITQEVFEEFTKENTGESKVDRIQTLVRCLPPAHRLTLKYFLEHLERVSKEKASNKMNAFNLSSVLMPSILGPENMSFDTIESGTRLLHYLMTHVEEAFKS